MGYRQENQRLVHEEFEQKARLAEQNADLRRAELEEAIAKEEGQFSDPDFFRTRAAEAGNIQKRIEALKAEYEKNCSRWEELESKRIV